MPTLALSGVGESKLSADDLRVVADQVSEVGISNGGHYVQEEKPDEVAAALRTFLDSSGG